MQEAADLAASNRTWRKANGISPTQARATGSETTLFAESESSSSTTAGFYRVLRTGVHLWALTNGIALSGIVGLPVEAGYSTGTLNSITLSANGGAIEGTPMLSQPFSSWPLAFAFDTRRLNNGTYSLRAAGTWALSATNDLDPGYVQFSTPAISVNISNLILYPNWVQEYRAGLLLMRAQSAKTNVDWQIDIYGEDESYIGSFTGHSANGIINFNWDVRGPGGAALPDNVLYTVTTIAAAGLAATSQLNPPLIRVVDNYPDEGKWIVARSSYMPTNYENYDLYVETMNSFAQMGEAAGGTLPAAPYRKDGEALVLYKQEMGTNSAALYRAFTNRTVRNFYFDGHGDPDSFGRGYDANGNARWFTTSLISGALGNSQASTNATRYRWVWIDSCSTALGGWPAAFGLGSRTNVALTEYTSRPGAFCGWDQDVYGFDHFQPRIKIEAVNYRSYFLLYWNAFEYGLKTSLDFAGDDSGFTDASHMRVYGYWGLHWYEFNTKGEWP